MRRVIANRSTVTVDAPQRADEPTYTGGPDTHRGLLILIALLFGIPAILVVGPLGAAGTPAQIIGLLLLLWWGFQRLLTGRSTGQSPWVRLILTLFVASLLLGYLAGMIRPTLGIEVRSADRGILSLASWMGIALTAMDGLRSRRALDNVMIGLAFAGGGLALLGILQFFTGFDPSQTIRIPGLQVNGFVNEIVRSNFRRAAGTATHPIEFGVVVSAVLPIALHYALSTSGRLRAWMWVVVAMLGAALPMAVARTAVIGAVVVLLMLFPTWERRLKLRALLVIVVSSLAMSVVVPGLLGTIRSMFVTASGDPSTQGRINDYGPVFRYWLESPGIGRGLGTFIPSVYRTVDNQYLGTLVESGIVGILGLLALFLGSIATCLRVRALTRDAVTRSLAISLAATVAVLAVTYATYDGLGFPMGTGILFLVVGAIGALEAQTRAAALADGTSSPPTAPTRRTRYAWTAAAVAVLLTAASTAAVLLSQPLRYTAQRAVLVAVPPVTGTNPYLPVRDADIATGIFWNLLNDDSTRTLVAASGGASDYGIAVGTGSLAVGTDVIGTGSTITVSVTEDSVPSAVAVLDATMNVLNSQIRDLQTRAGVPLDSQLAFTPVPNGAQVSVAKGNDKRALAAIGLLVLLAFVWILPRSSFVRSMPQPTLTPTGAGPPPSP